MNGRADWTPIGVAGCCLSEHDLPNSWSTFDAGLHLVVTPPERLEFTFAWETPNHEDGPGVQTHVIVLLEELANGGTRMHFSQSGFLSEKSAMSHSVGWNGTFDRLAEFLLDKNSQSVA